MSDHTPPTQPDSGVPPVPPAQSYPGFPPQQTPSAPTHPGPVPAQPGSHLQPAHPTHQAQPPRGPYGYAPGHVAQSPYATQGQPYPSPPYAAPARSTNGVAVAAMICGIVGLLFSPAIIAFLVPIIIPIAAVVLGHIAMSQLKRTPGTGGKGMALTGLILGYIPLAFSLLGLIVIIIVTVSIGAFTLPFVFAS